MKETCKKVMIVMLITVLLLIALVSCQSDTKELSNNKLTICNFYDRIFLSKQTG
jgi:hypothetical protein